jgi:phospholipid N-methyltransferase
MIKTNEVIENIAGFKISENGMIANIELNNDLRNKVLLNLFKLEDKIFFLEFKSIAISELIKELKERQCDLIVKSLELTQKKIKKEIKEINKTMKNLSKLI